MAASGLPELRASIASHFYPDYDASEVLVTPGVKQALYYFMLAKNLSAFAC